MKRRLIGTVPVLVVVLSLAGGCLGEDCRRASVDVDPEAAVSAGGRHACAVTEIGKIYCWGENDHGQLGDGTTSNRSTPVAVDGVDSAVAVAVGAFHSCGLLDDGTVLCWGKNQSGQLGNGTSNGKSPNPVAVEGLDSAVAISVGLDSTCALVDGGGVRCWGRNEQGQLGDGSTENRSSPVEVRGIDSAVSVSTSGFHTCAVLEEGPARCWGSNKFGQLGNGENGRDAASPTPVSVADIESAVSVSTTAITVVARTCAVLADGGVRCWGTTTPGDGGHSEWNSTPVAIDDLDSATTISTSVSAGPGCSCAVLEHGEVQCWGVNGEGQLGDGTTEVRSRPTAVEEIDSAVTVSTGGRHTCARLANGDIRCWGSNHHGELGIGGDQKRRTSPTAVQF